MKATPPRVPPPRHLVQPQLDEAAQDAAFRARRARFARHFQLDAEDVAILNKLIDEVSDLVMSEPPLQSFAETRARVRARIRDPGTEDLLVQIKDLEDDCELDPQTSRRLRALSRPAIEEILSAERHWEPSVQREVVQKLVQEWTPKAQASAVKGAMEAPKIVIDLEDEPKTPEAAAKPAEVPVQEVSPEAEAKTKQDAPKVPRLDVPQVGSADPLMQKVQGLIQMHHHSSAFQTEVNDYVKKLGTRPEVNLILQMLSASVASGIMMTCSTADLHFFLDQVHMVNEHVADLGQQLLARRNPWAAYYNWSFPGYAHWWMAQAQALKKAKKDKKSRNRKERKKGTKRRSSPSEPSESSAARPRKRRDELRDFRARLDALMEPGPNDGEQQAVQETDAGLAVNDQDELGNWLRSAGGGTGALLPYLPKIKEQYGDLRQLAAVRLNPDEAPPGKLGIVKPDFWQACGVLRMGHRLLLAKAISTL